jgi:copper chaperone NosL
MNARIPAAWLMLAGLVAMAGCSGEAPDGPPALRLGDTVCDECNMIISDERFATATIVEGPRGPEPRLFDDFNCQVGYELANADLEIVARWSHDHGSAEWMRTESATFVMSPNLRTPMASRSAAFASREDAERARAELTGDVMDFEIAWKRLALSGPCCPSDEGQDHEEVPDATDQSAPDDG